MRTPFASERIARRPRPFARRTARRGLAPRPALPRLPLAMVWRLRPKPAFRAAGPATPAAGVPLALRHERVQTIREIATVPQAREDAAREAMRFVWLRRVDEAGPPPADRTRTLIERSRTILDLREAVRPPTPAPLSARTVQGRPAPGAAPRQGPRLAPVTSVTSPPASPRAFPIAGRRWLAAATAAATGGKSPRRGADERAPRSAGAGPAASFRAIPRFRTERQGPLTLPSTPASRPIASVTPAPGTAAASLTSRPQVVAARALPLTWRNEDRPVRGRPGSFEAARDAGVARFSEVSGAPDAPAAGRTAPGAGQGPGTAVGTAAATARPATATLPDPALTGPALTDPALTDRLAEEIIRRIERRARIERERRGL